MIDMSETDQGRAALLAHLKGQVMSALDFADDRQSAYIADQFDADDEPMPTMGAENSLLMLKAALEEWSRFSGVTVDVSKLRYPGCLGDLALIRAAVEAV
jgi:hypothetical protein